jgi:hypothetical protein
MRLDDLKDISPDDVLAAVGLSIRRSSARRVLEATAFLGAGLVLGAGLALLLAPKSGKGLREEIGQKLGRFGKTGSNAGAPDAQPVESQA